MRHRRDMLLNSERHESLEPDGLVGFASGQLIDALTTAKDVIKVYCQVALYDLSAAR